MYGKRGSIGVFVLLVAMVVSATAAFAATVNPSVEITGGPAAGNYCAGGTVSVPAYFNINGAGATLTYMSVANPDISGFGQSTWKFAHVVSQGPAQAHGSFYPKLNGQNYVLPENTTVYLHVDSFDGQDRRTFRATVGFNCSTGAVVSLSNEAFVDPVVRVPVDGPRVVLPNEPVTMLPAVQEIIQINPRLVEVGRP